MERRTFLATSAAVLAMPAVGRAASRRVYRYIPGADLTVLDPIWATSLATRSHGYLVFDTLYGQTGPKHGFQATPQMVAGHAVEDDDKTWTLTLRDGPVFHDGQRVLARDCVASIRRWSARDPVGQALMQRTDQLSAPDDQTIQFRLKKPFPLLPDALGKAGGNPCVIMPERLAGTDPFKQVTEMVGSGPFRFKADERVSGSRAVYERFTDYKPREDGPVEWTSGPKIAHFDRIEWHTIPDPATAAAALMRGEVDEWAQPPGDLLPLLGRTSKIRLELVLETGFAMILRPNHLFPPFDNPAVRRALLPAFDQTETMIAVAGDDPSLRQVPCGFFSPGTPMASGAGMAALGGTRDYDRVKRELHAAGYKGEKVVLMVPTDFPNVHAASDVVADAMTRVGMEVDYQATAWGTLLQRRVSKTPPAQGGWNAFCTTTPGIDTFTPAIHYQLRGNGGQASPGWPTSPRIEALRDEWIDTPNLQRQQEIASEIQGQAFEDLPYWPLGHFYNFNAYRADITGTLHGLSIFWNLQRA